MFLIIKLFVSSLEIILDLAIATKTGENIEIKNKKFLQINISFVSIIS
jgi:hypothetical protein